MKCSVKLPSRSGAGVELDEEKQFVPATDKDNDGNLFRWWSITRQQSEELNTVTAQIRKNNSNSFTTDTELAICQAYVRLGYKTPKMSRVSDTELNLEFVPGLTFGEEMFYDPRLTPQIVVQKLARQYAISRRINNELENILTAEQKEYFMLKDRTYLQNKNFSEEDIAKTPLTCKIKAKFSEIGFNLGEEFYAVLGHLEQLLQRYGTENERWCLDSHAENFIGDTRIDFNGVSYGPLNHFVLLDTPYMLNDKFWMQRLHEPNLSNYQAIEQAKCDLIASAATEDGDDNEHKFISYQLSKVFRDTLLVAYSYQDAIAAAQTESPMWQPITIMRSLNNLFGYYEMADTGLHSAARQLSGEISHSEIETYVSVTDKMVRNMTARIVPTSEKLQEHYGHFAMVWPGYPVFKQNSRQFMSGSKITVL